MTYKVTKLKSIFCLTVTIHFCYYGYIVILPMPWGFESLIHIRIANTVLGK